MSSFIVLRKSFDLSADSRSHLLVGRQSRDIVTKPDDGSVVTTIRRHYGFTIDVSFDSQGGSQCSSMTFTLGETCKGLPSPTKTQCIFDGWYTQASGGSKVDDSVKAELSCTTLYAHWEFVQIENDCTQFTVQTTASYKKAGIYSASRYSSTSAVYVDWGDGSVQKVDGNISQLAHTYGAAGTFNVKVSNNVTSFAASANNSAWHTTTSQNRYTLKNVVKTGSKVTSMPSCAFYYCAALSSIDFLSSCYTSVTALPSYAFTYCTSIKTLSSLPARVKALGSYCFQQCTGLTGIQDLRNTGLTSLTSYYALAGCSQVKEWKLPTQFGTFLGTGVFSNNTSLSAIELPSALTSISQQCFNGDSALLSVSVPANVVIIYGYAFQNCTKLSTVQYKTAKLTCVDSYAFSGCASLRNVDLPQSVKTINDYAFQKCYSSYMSSLALPSALKALGTYAFYNCNQLRDIEIPSSLATIQNYAFAGCYRVSAIVDRRFTAQTTYANTFGLTAANAANGYTGYATKGNNILCTYVVATGYEDGYWADPLQNATKCGFKMSYIDPENLKYCQVTFDAGEGELSDSIQQFIQNKKIGKLPKPTAPSATPYFGGWWTKQNGAGTKYTSQTTVPAQESLTLYALYGTTPFRSYEIDLNDNWVQSTTQPNPDATAYDGVYESDSNYNINSAYAKMYVYISGYETFKLCIRSYAESFYDYTIAFNPDIDVTSNPSSSTTGVKAHTSGKQTSGTALSNYIEVNYTNLNEEDHFICIVYRKDRSSHSGTDRGYLLVPKKQD